MRNLKQTNFILGKDQNTFSYRSSENVGKFAKTARVADSTAWGANNSSWRHGNDQENKTSDYAMRFQPPDQTHINDG